VDFFYFVNLADASPWLRRSWSPNYSVLVLIGSQTFCKNDKNMNIELFTPLFCRVVYFHGVLAKKLVSVFDT
jgi:hypothetical protein